MPMSRVLNIILIISSLIIGISCQKSQTSIEDLETSIEEIKILNSEVLKSKSTLSGTYSSMELTTILPDTRNSVCQLNNKLNFSGIEIIKRNDTILGVAYLFGEVSESQKYYYAIYAVKEIELLDIGGYEQFAEGRIKQKILHKWLLSQNEIIGD